MRQRAAQEAGTDCMRSDLTLQAVSAVGATFARFEAIRGHAVRAQSIPSAPDIFVLSFVLVMVR